MDLTGKRSRAASKVFSSVFCISVPSVADVKDQCF